MADKLNATVTFRLPNITNSVRFIEVHSLKSYGALWQGSLARFDVVIAGGRKTADNSSSSSFHTSFSIEGFHAQNNSLTYPFALDLAENLAPIGSDLNVTITLTGGSIFKITGMLFCSR